MVKQLKCGNNEMAWGEGECAGAGVVGGVKDSFVKTGSGCEGAIQVHLEEESARRDEFHEATSLNVHVRFRQNKNLQPDLISRY